jgi:cytochrome c553
MKTAIVFMAAALALGARVASAQPQDARALATGVCSACHGPEGRSISPVFPRLAGQTTAYVVLQLDAFRNHVRGDPNAQAYMWGMASQLSDATIKALGEYYASQKPVTVKSDDAALLSEGQKIYSHGVPSENVPACASCHGPHAEGRGAFPRLAGQHIEYLVSQLQGFQSGLRANAPIMQGVVRSMNAEQFKAAATYAATR